MLDKQRFSGIQSGNPVKVSPIWQVEEVEKNSHRLIFKGAKKDWKASILLLADEHWDNQHSDWNLIRKHHQQALDCNAPIFKFGDTLCLMQGKWDRRADQNQLRDAHRGNNYLDLIEETAAEFYEPYAKNIVLWTPGNHEQSILDRHQTDITERILTRIKANTGHKISKGAFSGFVTVCIERPQDDRIVDWFQIYYHHGYGGGGEVTRGMIDNNRTRGQVVADVYVSGHIHRRNMDENVALTCTANGKMEYRKQLFLRCSSYKDEYEHGRGGWHVSQGRAARPIGGWWLDLSYAKPNRGNAKLMFEPRPA